MTAPDPGLTDLLAAHKIQLFGVDGPHYQAETEYDGCLCGWQGAEEDHPAHVALVVEQHTNGRTAELEHWKARSQYNYDCGMVLANEANARAEKAEATIARVEKALEGVCDSCDYTDLRAALEGES